MPAIAPAAVFSPATSAVHYSGRNTYPVWFDAVDELEINEAWFDAREDEQWFDAQQEAFPAGGPRAQKEPALPLSEDCRRCLIQVISRLGGLAQGELIATGLARLLPGMPAEIIAAANHLYYAVITGKNTDLALLTSLGLASDYLLAEGNPIACVASYLRESLLAYLGEATVGQLLTPEQHAAGSAIFTALAVAAVAVRYLVKDAPQPQRRMLRLPAGLASLLVRASHYWRQLTRIAQRAQPQGEEPALLTRPALAASTETCTRALTAGVRHPTSAISELREQGPDACPFRAPAPVRRSLGATDMLACDSWHTRQRCQRGHRQSLRHRIQTRGELQPHFLRTAISQPAALYLRDPLVFPAAVARPLQREAAPDHDARVRQQLGRFFKPPTLTPDNDTPGPAELAAEVVNYLKNNDPKKIQALSKAILATQNSYGSEPAEPVSRWQAQQVVRHWFFTNFLGMELAEYLARKVATDNYPGYFTLSSIRVLLSAEHFQAAGRFHYQHLPQPLQAPFTRLCESWLQEELPFLYQFRADRKMDALALVDDAFAALYSGSRYLAGRRLLHKFSWQEVITIGQIICASTINGADEQRQLAYLLLPAALSVAQRSPEIITALTPQNDYRQVLLAEYLRYQQACLQADSATSDALNAFSTALNSWRSKGQLAEDIIRQCPPEQQPPLWQTLPAGQHYYSTRQVFAKERYLLGIAAPCDTAPPGLEAEYQRLTVKVADRFQQLDALLLAATLNGAEKKDRDFIFSADAVIYPVNFSMKTEEGLLRATGDIIYQENISVNLNNTELFAVLNQGQERIYGLKAHQNTAAGYRLLRLDRNINDYIRNNILDYAIYGNYQLDRQRLTVINKALYGVTANASVKTVFTINIDIDKQRPLQQGGGIQQLLASLQTTHRDRLFNELYLVGKDKSRLETIWEVIKHFIPFYDCIDESVNQNPEAAVPACLLDAMALIPAAGNAVSMGARFGMGLARGLRLGWLTAGRGVSLAVTRQALLRQVTLPGIREYTLLGKNALRLFDPGLELVVGGSRTVTKRLVQALLADTSTLALGKRLATLSSHSRSSMPDTAIIVSDPATGLEVSAKQAGTVNGNVAYVMIDAETGEAVGKRYYLYGDELSTITATPESLRTPQAVPLALQEPFHSLQDYLKQIITADCHSASSSGRVRRCIPLSLFRRSARITPPPLPAEIVQLPSEILGEIFAYLDIKDLSILAQLGGRYEAEAVRVFNLRERNGLVRSKNLLLQAIKADDVDIVRLLRNQYIQFPVNFLARTRNGNNVVMYCAVNGRENVMRELLTLPGLDINHASTIGNNALILAARANNRATLSVLLSHPGINVNHANNGGESALMLAAAYGYTEAVGMLLRAPLININAANHYGQTALMLAMLGARKKAVTMLLRQADIDVNKANAYGTTPLMIAAGQGQRKLVNALLKHPQIKADSVNRFGMDAQELARRGGHSKIAGLLAKKKATA